MRLNERYDDQVVHQRRFSTAAQLYEGPRDAPYQLKSSQLLHNLRHIAFEKACSRRMNLKVAHGL